MAQHLDFTIEYESKLSNPEIMRRFSKTLTFYLNEPTNGNSKVSVSKIEGGLIYFCVDGETDMDAVKIAIEQAKPTLNEQVGIFVNYPSLKKADHHEPPAGGRRNKKYKKGTRGNKK